MAQALLPAASTLMWTLRIFRTLVLFTNCENPPRNSNRLARRKLVRLPMPRIDAASQGETEEEARANLKEALERTHPTTQDDRVLRLLPRHRSKKTNGISPGF